MSVVEHDGVAIHFEDVGQGPAVVLGHSFLCAGTMWRFQVPVLARTHRVVNIDLRGHGRSGPAAQPFTLYDVVGEVVAVLDALGIERATWCGLSIGGMVALRAALTHPERVAGLVLLDTDAGAESAWKKLKYRAMAAVVRAVGVRPLLPTVARLMFGTTTLREQPGLVGSWREECAEIHVPSTLRCLDALIRRDCLLERLGTIESPALVGVGEEDRSLPVPQSRRLHERLPESTLAIFEGAGHLSALERPEPVNRALRGFLARQPRQ